MINVNNNKFLLTDFGVIPNSDKLQTKEFQSALDKIFCLGGGTLTVPDGTYKIGGIRIRSNTTLYLCSGAVLMASRDPEDYHGIKSDTVEPIPDSCNTDVPWAPRTKNRDFSFLLAGSRWNNAIIRALYAENVSIIGESGSVIDGCDCYDALGEENYRGPHGINMHYCKNVRFEGYTIRNTGNWAHCMQYSSSLSWKKITVEGGHDGIHTRGCHDISIESCEFYTGDDCVAGFGNYNVSVKGCLMNTACSAFRYGGTDVLIEDCRCFGPAKFLFRGSLTTEEKISGAKSSSGGRHNMLSMFTYYADTSVKIEKQPENIVIRNCTVSNCDRFIHYNFSGNEIWQLATPLKSLILENIEARDIRMPLTAYGSPGLPLTLTMKNISFTFTDEIESQSFMHAAHFAKLDFENITVNRRGKGPFIRSWSHGGETFFKNVISSQDEPIEVTFTEEIFKCRPI